MFSAGLNNRYVNNYALFEVSVYQKTRILETGEIEYLPRVVFVEVFACIWTLKNSTVCISVALRQFEQKMLCSVENFELKAVVIFIDTQGTLLERSKYLITNRLRA